MGLPGVFVGFGVGSYADEGHGELPDARSQVVDLAAIVTPDLAGAPILDPTAEEVRERLEDVRTDAVGGRLLLVWAGHGKPEEGEGLRLLTVDSGMNPRAGLAVGDVVGACVESGASQILVVLDTCFAGGGVAAASNVAASVLRSMPPAGRAWVGVVASCQSWETAQDGVFGRRLLDLIRHGPQGWSCGGRGRGRTSFCGGGRTSGMRCCGSGTAMSSI